MIILYTVAEIICIEDCGDYGNEKRFLGYGKRSEGSFCLNRGGRCPDLIVLRYRRLLPFRFCRQVGEVPVAPCEGIFL
jgi:hypothetical protein